MRLRFCNINGRNKDGRFSTHNRIDTLTTVADSVSAPAVKGWRPQGRRSMRKASATVVGVMWIGLAMALAEAQAPLHDSQYADADIAYGAALYASKCVTCHGTQGDAIGGVNLRSGTFRNAVIDRDLDRFIRTGSPAGMPAFPLDAADMAGIVAYLRNMNAFDAATVKAGDEA